METERRSTAPDAAPQRLNRVRRVIGRWKSAAFERYGISPNRIMALVPGLLLVAMGFSMLFAPSFFVALLSGLLLYIGMIALFVGFKVIHLHGRFRDALKQIETRIYIRGVDIGEMVDQAPRSEPNSKKVTYH